MHPNHFSIRPLPVASITVIHRPNAERLSQQLAALSGQVDDIIIVDNREKAELGNDQLALSAVTRVRPEGGNVGVAAGFNAGIEHARRRGAQLVLLLDQDSVPAGDMVERLLEAMASRTKVAAAGPLVRDARDHRELPFVRIGWLRNVKCRCGSQQAYVTCDFLISSGALIDINAFDRIGPFDEALFIDNVDLEWCLRARSKGFTLLGCCNATLDHQLGDGRVRVGRVSIAVHSPERLYYMTRNRLLLYRRPYMPWGWKWKDALRGLLKCTAMAVLVAPRKQYAAMALHGLIDALANRGGKRLPR